MDAVSPVPPRSRRAAEQGGSLGTRGDARLVPGEATERPSKGLPARDPAVRLELRPQRWAPAALAAAPSVGSASRQALEVPLDLRMGR